MGEHGDAAAAPRPRIEWLDVAKGLGMVLVFYGHFVEGFARVGVSSASVQMQFVYAFHMPLFFFLGGLLYRPSTLPLTTLVLRRLRRLIVPAVVFNVVGAVLWLALIDQDRWAALSTGWWRFVTEGALVWNCVLWFLIAFFFVIVAQDLLTRLSNSTLVLALSATAMFGLLSLWPTDAVAANPWYLRSAAAGFIFFQIGVLIARHRMLDRMVGWRAPFTAALALAALLATLHLNFAPLIMMVDGAFGDLPLFVLGGLAGALFVSALARIPSNKKGTSMLRALGRRTLPLLCLNGLLLALVNVPIARFMLDAGLGHDALSITVVSLVYTAVSLALSLPVAMALERWLPWSVGSSRS